MLMIATRGYRLLPLLSCYCTYYLFNSIIFYVPIFIYNTKFNSQVSLELNELIIMMPYFKITWNDAELLSQTAVFSNHDEARASELPGTRVGPVALFLSYLKLSTFK